MKTLTSQTLKIYWQHSMRYKMAFTLTIAGLLCENLANAIDPILYKRFFDIIGSHVSNAGSLLIQTVVYILIAGAIGWGFKQMWGWAILKYQISVMRDLLNTCFDYLHRHSYAYFTNNFAGSLVRKVNRYSKAFEDLTDQIMISFLQVFVRVVLITVVLFLRSWLLGVLILAWSLIYTAINYFLSVHKLKYDLLRAEIDTKVTAQLSDTISNNINIKLFGGIKQEQKDFRALTNAAAAQRTISWTLANYSDGVQGALMIILEFVMMYAAVKYWQRGIVTIGDFALIQGYLVQLFNQLWSFGRNIRRIYESLADANEMTDILLTPYEVQDKKRAPALIVKKAEIQFKDMTYGYHDTKPVFANFNLKIKPGERVALIGPSGGGKTTVTKLLLRFMDIQAGEILIDGQNIANVTQESLRSNIAMVPQEPILFHRSLLENISYARPGASEKEVIAASRLAHCHEFISAFPDRYNTYVGERGIKLSGGERQRVAIARAILKDAPILVLDEATSSLDSESESLIQDALHTLMKQRTTIVIAHRLSTIMQMDRILVLDGGKIVEEGTHDKLLEINQGTYQKLWGIQAGGFGQAA